MKTLLTLISAILILVLNPAGRVNGQGNIESIVEDSITKVTDSLFYDPENPMFGLNSYVPAYDTTWMNDTDWYGSGDFDGDGDIDWDDYNFSVSGYDPFYDGTYRADTDLDGVSGTENDRQILYEYLTGERTHINRWELETLDEKQSHLEKALAIDPTSEVDPWISGWTCGKFMGQTFVNFSGVYDIENSTFGEPNGTNLEFDIEHNGMFRIPLRYVNTYTTAGINHFINGVYMGSPENQDATSFDYWTFIEPQTGEVVVPGDYSIDPDKFANIDWYGYYYNDFISQWKYGSRNLIDYDLEGGQIVNTDPHDELIYSWTPFEKVWYPLNKVRSFPPDTSVASNGYPLNIYNGTIVSYSDESDQTGNGECSDVAYYIDRNWELIAGAYNKGNSTNGYHTQHIHVIDISKPAFTSFPPDTLITKNDPMRPEYLGYPEWTDNSNLPIEPHYNDELLESEEPFEHWARHWTGTDVCENISIDSIQHIYVDQLEFVPEKSLDFTIYPNPSKGTINISGNWPEDAPIEYCIFNSQGIKIRQYQIVWGSKQQTISLSGMPPGLYMVGFKSQKAIKFRWAKLYLLDH